MKKMWLSIFLICVLALSACGKDDYSQLVVGTWYHEGSSTPAFTLYDDGTCEIAGEYGEGKWSVVNDNQLKLSNYYGETETAVIVSVDNKCLILENEAEQRQFFSSAQTADDASKTREGDENKIESDSVELENFRDDVEKVAETSEVTIVNVMDDGTLWIIEKDEEGQQYIVHTNVYGEVLGKAINDFDGYMEKGLDSNLFAIDNGDADISIYDINSLQDMTNVYKGDFDGVIEVIQTEQDSVFVARKIIESFEESYACLKLVDIEGNELFDISLDSNTLLKEYNIERVKTAEQMEINYAGNNIYYIDYIGSAYDSGQINSLIIDLNRNKVIPVAFPHRNGLYCSSDGNYTLIYCPQYGTIIVNNETEVVARFANTDYKPKGDLEEGVFYAISYGYGGREDKAFLDVQGNIVIDLEQYSQEVDMAWPFKDGKALIEFTNGYMTYVDMKGEFLFEPVKGHVLSYDEKEDVVSAYIENEANEYKYIAIDKTGNVTDINLQYYRDYFFVEYEGKKYWVVGGKAGLQTQEYISLSGED